MTIASVYRPLCSRFTVRVKSQLPKPVIQSSSWLLASPRYLEPITRSYPSFIFASKAGIVSTGQLPSGLMVRMTSPRNSGHHAHGGGNPESYMHDLTNACARADAANLAADPGDNHTGRQKGNCCRPNVRAGSDRREPKEIIQRPGRENRI